MDDAKKLPDGVLAAEILNKDSESAAIVANAYEAKNPAELPVDPNYMEPTTVEQYERMAFELIKEADGIEDSVSRQRKLAIVYLIQRIKVLQSALLPFGVIGTVFSNAKIDLTARGRPEEPAGGTWCSNPPDNIALQPNEKYFYNAIDALGRAHVQGHMTQLFQTLQANAALMTEKANHDEAGGTTH